MLEQFPYEHPYLFTLIAVVAIAAFAGCISEYIKYRTVKLVAKPNTIVLNDPSKERTKRRK